MPVATLNKPLLRQKLKELMNSLKNQEDNQDAAINTFADGLADAIIAFVESGTVTTVGSSTTQTGNIR